MLLTCVISDGLASQISDVQALAAVTEAGRQCAMCGLANSKLKHIRMAPSQQMQHLPESANALFNAFRMKLSRHTLTRVIYVVRSYSTTYSCRQKSAYSNDPASADT